MPGAETDRTPDLKRGPGAGRRPGAARCTGAPSSSSRRPAHCCLSQPRLCRGPSQARSHQLDSRGDAAQSLSARPLRSPDLQRSSIKSNTGTGNTSFCQCRSLLLSKATSQRSRDAAEEVRQMPEEVTDAGAPQGLSWSWELDFDALMAAIAGADPSLPGASGADSSGTGSEPDHEAALDDANALQDDLDGPGPEEGDGPRLPASALAGRVAERLAPGPDLAAWLAMAPAADLEGAELAAVAGSWRRVAAWAQARELAAVAQIASRTAARDKEIGTGADGRPARVPDSAAAEVALELTMSQYGASWWTDLAVTLGWRLAATGAALDAGVIDLSRARLIAEATATLSDETARAVEERVLPAAGEQTTGMLRAALRRAVIAADPQGAEERRNESERRAKVVLYPDEENTATLAGQRLPGVHAAAAMARIKAMARAMKASGAGGGMDLLCAQVYLGLLLGTLPPIPPAEGAPPDPPGDRPHGGPGDGPHGGPGNGRGGGPGSGPACGTPGSRPAGGA